MLQFPTIRHRRLRYNPIIRDMVRETELMKNDLIYPLFVVPGSNIKNPVKLSFIHREQSVTAMQLVL